MGEAKRLPTCWEASGGLNEQTIGSPNIGLSEIQVFNAP
jgi:hypothetical protein